MSLLGAEVGPLLSMLPVRVLNNNVCRPPLPMVCAARTVAVVNISVGITEISVGHGSF